MAQKHSDIEKIKQLIEIMKQNDLTELAIEHGEDKIALKRSESEPARYFAPAVAPSAGSGAEAKESPGIKEPSAEVRTEEELVEIPSPLVGTFYAGASPDSEPYVETGSQVESQPVVCIIEAMKVMNEIKSERSGTIAEILVKNGEAVEYGQPLFKLRPGDS